MNKTLLLLLAFALGPATISLPVHADSAMDRMDISSANISTQTKPVPLSVTATITPAAPQTGSNMLDLLVTGPDGKPVTGLKLTTNVAMTSMDMGTTHPIFKEIGGGHYRAKISFTMNGPWQVVVHNQSNKIAVLDFAAGSKTPWKSPQIISAAPVATSMAAAKPTDQPVSIPAVTKTTDTIITGMGEMKMSGIADMQTATVPELKETGSYIATGEEDWKLQTGFGHNAPMVGMMNQMMVGGSGAEGMKMAPMSMKFGEENYAKPDVSDSTPPAAPATVKITAIITSAPRAGDNPLSIRLSDTQGKPITGAKISASVAMTSMDMGTTHPTVTEKGLGLYTSTINFSMAGPWRVQVTVTPPGQKPQTKAFDFTAK